jgi:AcrR family transcriptional regulator
MPVAKGAALDPGATRATIVATAADLLYERGLDGVGVSELCRRIGISKETLYRHFGSKEGLVGAVLETRSERVVRWLRDAASAADSDPAARLTAVFDALDRWYAEPAFRGCGIVNAATQHHDDPARAVAARHLNRHIELLTDIAVDAGAEDPHTLARQLLMLVEGATVVADHHGSAGAARDARSAALTLLRAAAADR